MHLPAALRAALDQAITGFPSSQLEREAAALSDAYRAGRPPKLDTEAARAAYAVVRLPATYAAVRHAVAELPLDPEATANDLGSGFGAAAWALHEHANLQAITLIERNQALLDWAKKLNTPGTPKQQDLTAAIPPADLQLFSYSLGELSTPNQSTTLTKAWQQAKRALVVIEPGTMPGFAVIRRARQQLLDQGAHILAPCPHEAPCPMQQNDWCHFAARVERSALHRRLKGGSLSYEDEKFSYVIATREPTAQPDARIIRHPQIQPGLINLTLCENTGELAQRNIRQKDKEQWKHARKAEWGGRWASIR